MLKPKPWWLFWTPSNFWVTLYPNIYHPHNQKPEEEIMAHENVHLRREQELGLVTYLFRYIFSRSFRLQEEVLAVKAMLDLHPNNELRREWIINFQAENLSSWKYLWAAWTKQQAIAALRR